MISACAQGNIQITEPHNGKYSPHEALSLIIMPGQVHSQQAITMSLCPACPSLLSPEL